MRERNILERVDDKQDGLERRGSVRDRWGAQGAWRSGEGFLHEA